EHDRALWRLRHAHAMPLQCLRGGRLPAEDVIALAFLGERDVENADLRRTLRTAGAAERIGQQLMSQADAEKRPLQLPHPAADRLLLRDQPGMLLDVPDIHRPAHDPERVIAAEIGNRLARVELYGVPRHAVGAQKLAEDAGMLHGDMLEDEDAHRLGPFRLPILALACRLAIR